MSWREEFSELIQLLDESTAAYPNRLFSNTPEKDSTPVRRIAFAFENMVDQLKKPLVPSTQALAQALVYKFNGPHRRQGYWMNYKNLSRALRKYNEDDLLKRVSDVHKKGTASGAGFYMPSSDVIRYIGSAYLKRLFRLQQIQDLCIRTAHVIMGQLELGHWEKFSLFIVALCADINNGISNQVSSMESAYASLSSFLVSIDERFPKCLSDLSIFSNLRGRISAQKTVDTARVMQLLQLTDDQLEAMRTKDQMTRFKDEILSSMETNDDSIDLGVVMERNGDEKSESDLPSLDLRKVSSTDSGFEIDSEPSTSIANVANEEAGEDEVFEEEIIVQREQKTGKKLRKRKKKNKSLLQHTLNATPVSSIFESTDTQYDDSSLMDSSKICRRKKMKRKSNENEDDSLISPLLASSPLTFSSEVVRSTKKGKKKRLLRKVLSTNLDLPTPEDMERSSLLPSSQTSLATPSRKMKKKAEENKSMDKGAVTRKRKSIDTFDGSSFKVISKKKKKRQIV
ncbi:hypothetical protein RB195_020646 [Necator americanus]